MPQLAPPKCSKYKNHIHCMCINFFFNNGKGLLRLIGHLPVNTSIWSSNSGGRQLKKAFCRSWLTAMYHSSQTSQLTLIGVYHGQWIDVHVTLPFFNKMINRPISLLVVQVLNSRKDHNMNKGVKIAEVSENRFRKCCEKCHEVAPLTNAGHHGYEDTCFCFLVTGKYLPQC